MPDAEFLPGWTPDQDICIAFDDKTGECKTNAQLKAFIADVTEAANKHGFDLNQIATRAGFARFIHRTTNPDGTYKDS